MELYFADYNCVININLKEKFEENLENLLEAIICIYCTMQVKTSAETKAEIF